MRQIFIILMAVTVVACGQSADAKSAGALGHISLYHSNEMGQPTTPRPNTMAVELADAMLVVSYSKHDTSFSVTRISSDTSLSIEVGSSAHPVQPLKEGGHKVRGGYGAGRLPNMALIISNGRARTECQFFGSNARYSSGIMAECYETR